MSSKLEASGIVLNFTVPSCVVVACHPFFVPVGFFLVCHMSSMEFSHFS